MASLMVGLDFFESEVFVGLWAEEDRSPKTFSVPKKSQGDHIPLFVVPVEDGQFLAGHEGLEYSINYNISGVSLLYGNGVKESVTLKEREYDVRELLAGFLGDVLGAIKKYYGGAQIARLCITGERMNPVDKEHITSALRLLGFSDNQFCVINHANAFLYYMVGAGEERRKTKAATIDLDSAGACIYSYVPADNRLGAPGYVRSENTDLLLRQSLEEIEGVEEKVQTFENIISMAMTLVRPISVLYVTGRSISDERIKNVLKGYASERMKIFSGQNLYSSGACTRAVNDSIGEKYITDGSIFHSVSMEGYKDAVIDEVVLLPAGSELLQAKRTISVIPDDTRELIFHVKDMRTGQRKTISFVLDELEIRENKTNRLQITVSFIDLYTIVIKVRDMGFGDIYPASFRVWEQIVRL